MDALFNYKEFVRLSHEGNIKYEKLKVPKHTDLVNTASQRNNHVYLIVEGFVSISMNPQSSSIYTVLGKGSFVNYYSLFQGNVDDFLFTTISPCTIYKYSFKDLEYFLSMFPENFGFQFFIMRDLARHAFFKSLFAETSSSDKLELSFLIWANYTERFMKKIVLFYRKKCELVLSLLIAIYRKAVFTNN